MGSKKSKVESGIPYGKRRGESGESREKRWGIPDGQKGTCTKTKEEYLIVNINEKT